MRKAKLTEAVTAHKTETKEALQTVIDSLNNGQRKKLTSNETVKTLLDRYGVII